MVGSSRNPHEKSSRDTSHAQSLSQIEQATVIGHVSDVGDPPVVKLDNGMRADVLPDADGDSYVPPEGSLVLILHRRKGSRPSIIGYPFTPSDDPPALEPGERQLGHPFTDARVRWSEDGELEIVSDNLPYDSIPDEAAGTVTLSPDGAVTVESDDGTNYTSTVEMPANGSLTLTTDAAGTTTTVECANDGTITVESNAGTTLVVENGQVRVDNGSTGVIEDVTTTTDEDGHVTGISLERSDTLYI